MLIFSENYMIDISQLLMDIIKLFNFYDITHSLVDYQQKVCIFFSFAVVIRQDSCFRSCCI